MARWGSGRRRLLAAGCASVLAFVLAGCLGQSEIRPRETSGAISPSPPPSPFSAGPLLHPTPLGENLHIIASLDSQRGSFELGTFAREGDTLYVDVLCIGSGFVDVTIEGIASFMAPCTGDGSPQTHNDNTSSFVDSFTVSVAATNSQRWAITVSRPS